MFFSMRTFKKKNFFIHSYFSGNKVFPNREELIKESLKIAEIIASKSPVALQAIKRNLIYSLDHTNQEGLDHIVRF